MCKRQIWCHPASLQKINCRARETVASPCRMQCHHLIEPGTYVLHRRLDTTAGQPGAQRAHTFGTLCSMRCRAHSRPPGDSGSSRGVHAPAVAVLEEHQAPSVLQRAVSHPDLPFFCPFPCGDIGLLLNQDDASDLPSVSSNTSSLCAVLHYCFWWLDTYLLYSKARATPFRWSYGSKASLCLQGLADCIQFPLEPACQNRQG